MSQVDLLRSLPRTKRNIKKREQNKTEQHISISCQFGADYFDGSRDYGYGGYYYDGRWKSVARDIVQHFKLKRNSKVLDVGCGKGFLVKDLVDIGMDAYGIDISRYALNNAPKEISNRLTLGSCDELPFEDKSFDCVISINTIHNLDRDGCVKSCREIERLAPGMGFIQVDSFNNKKQKEIFESWVLTAKFYDYPSGWIKVFNEAKYTGYWYWTIME